MREDYPRTIIELEDRFSDDAACRDDLARLRWPAGFVCPRCSGTEAWNASRGRMICRACRHQASVTAGTIFDRVRKPLRLWFRAIWYVTSQKNGCSAVGLQQVLGLRSYQTAWTWLHKLRRAMVRPGRDRLGGRVEVDETFVGGDEPQGIVGKYTKKAVVVIAAEENGRGIGRIRMARIPSPSKVRLRKFIQDSVEQGSAIHTDGLMNYRGIEDLGYHHEISVLSGQSRKDAAVQLLPRVHRIAALLKRWLLGTHQGSVSFKHIDYYLDEFTFRFNRRTSRSRGKLFFRLVQQALQVDPAPYHFIVGAAELD